MVTASSIKPSLPCTVFRELLEDSYHKRDIIQRKRGSFISLEKNNLWIVVRGVVKLESKSSQGDDILLGLAGANEVFGAPLTKVQPYEAKALADCDLLCISTEEVKASPALALALIEGISARYRQAELFISLLGLNLVEERIKGLLSLLADEYGCPCKDGCLISLRLTHQDLANALGTTRVTVTRIIGSLRVEGWLKTNADKSIIIYDKFS